MTRIVVTAACDADLVADANQLAMALAFGPEDARTYTGLNWQDGAGRTYAAASWQVVPAWLDLAQSSLVRPAWDVGQIIDMDAAGRAQAALDFWAGDGPVPQARPGVLVAVAGMDGRDALAAMGLEPVPMDPLGEEGGA